MLNILLRLRQSLASRLGAIRAALDLRDVLFFGGLALLTYGLHLYRPWLAFATCGALLMLIGYLIRGKT